MKYDLVIIGSGILGTFHAYHALKKNLKVALIEKNSFPISASVRNFGQIIPSGLNSKWQKYGRASIEIYTELQSYLDFTIRQNGTYYIASNNDELKLIEELNKINLENDYESFFMTKKECLRKIDGLRAEYCKGGLFFPLELTIDSNEMLTKFHAFLVSKYGLQIFYNSTVISTSEDASLCKTECSNGEVFLSSKIIICNGHEFKILYPKIFNESNLIATKLQMFQTKEQGMYYLSGNILTGSSIRRYESFSECPSFQKITTKYKQTDEGQKYGVHILFKQSINGSVLIGDSHEYSSVIDSDKLGFESNEEIDDYILESAKNILDLPSFEISKRWVGYYSQSANNDIFEYNPTKNIHIITGLGGKGMTISPSLSKEIIDKYFI